MNRPERRVQERKDSKTIKWISNLTQWQEEAINAVVDQRVNKSLHAIKQALDTSVAAAIISKTELSIQETESILDVAGEFMKESQNFLNRYGDEWIMEINKMKPQIKKECLAILDKGITANNEAVKQLKKVFSKAPQKDLVNIFKETSEEYKSNEKAIEELSDEIAGEILEEVGIKNKPISKEKVLSNNISQENDLKQSERVSDRQNGLLKLRYPIIVEGQEGRAYKITENSVQSQDKIFKSLQDIEEYKNQILESLNNHIEEIKEAFNYISL